MSLQCRQLPFDLFHWGNTTWCCLPALGRLPHLKLEQVQMLFVTHAHFFLGSVNILWASSCPPVRAVLCFRFICFKVHRTLLCTAHQGASRHIDVVNPSWDACKQCAEHAFMQ